MYARIRASFDESGQPASIDGCVIGHKHQDQWESWRLRRVLIRPRPERTTGCHWGLAAGVDDGFESSEQHRGRCRPIDEVLTTDRAAGRRAVRKPLQPFPAFSAGRREHRGKHHLGRGVQSQQL